MRGVILSSILLSALYLSAQTGAVSTSNNLIETTPTQITVPAGTQVLLHLRSPIDTRTAKVGDGVYCQTSFPITQNNVAVIPLERM